MFGADLEREGYKRKKAGVGCCVIGTGWCVIRTGLGDRRREGQVV